jgi:hypothetical protein
MSKSSEHSVRPNVLPASKTIKSDKRRLSTNQKISFSLTPDIVYRFPKVSQANARIIWYGHDNYNKMKKHTDQSLQKLEEGKLVESSQECLVGLLHMSEQAMETKFQRYQDVRVAVFQEQKYQRKMGIVDAMRIAEVYSDCVIASDCRTEAVMMALGMEASVKRDQSSCSLAATSTLVPSASANMKFSPMLRAVFNRTGLRSSSSSASSSRR